MVPAPPRPRTQTARRALVAAARWVAEALVSLLIFPAQSLAQESDSDAASYGASRGRIFDLRTGDFFLKPDLRVREMYDNNIFLERIHRDRDFITFVEPSVGAGYEGEALQAQVFYRASLREYHHHTDRDLTEHFASGSGRWKSGPFFVRASGGWSRQYAALESQTIPLAKSRQRTQGAAVGLDKKDWGLELEYDRRAFDLEKSPFDFFDHDTASVTARGLLRLAKSTVGFVEATGGRTHFEESRKDDNEFGQALAGVMARLSPKVNLTARVGWRAVDYERDSGTSPFDDDFSGPVFAASLVWTPTGDDRVAIDAGRSVSESLISNYIDTFSLDLSYTRRLAKGWKLTPFLGWADANESSRSAPQFHKIFQTIGVNTTYDVAKGVTLEGGWRYREKQTNDLNGTFIDTQTFLGVRVRF